MSNRSNKIEELYHATPTAENVLNCLASVEKDEFTTVQEVQEWLEEKGMSVGRQSVIDQFKKLEELKLGEYKVGRRGHPTRFEWNELGRQNLLKNNLPSEVDGEDSSPRPATLEHEYKLRPNFSVTLELPEDLTDKEASRLAGYIKTLPFE